MVHDWSKTGSVTERLMLKMVYNGEQSHNLPLLLNFLSVTLTQTGKVNFFRELLDKRNKIVHMGYKLSDEEVLSMEVASREIVETLVRLGVRKGLK